MKFMEKTELYEITIKSGFNDAFIVANTLKNDFGYSDGVFFITKNYRPRRRRMTFMVVFNYGRAEDSIGLLEEKLEAFDVAYKIKKIKV